MKKSVPCFLSHQNKSTDIFVTGFTCKRCLVCAYFSPDSDKAFFTLEEAILCLEDSYFTQTQQFEVKNILIMNLFITNMQLFSSQNVNWWAGVMWITCGLLWCFFQLFELSLWRHPFSAEDPLASNVKFLQICSDEEANSTFGMAWEWVHFQIIFIFGWTIPLIFQFCLAASNDAEKRTLRAGLIFWEISVIHFGQHRFWSRASFSSLTQNS